MPYFRPQMRWDGDRLKIGGRLSGFAIVPDETFPAMWRVRQPNGSLSDMMNRTRAKDAAMDMAERHAREIVQAARAS